MPVVAGQPTAALTASHGVWVPAFAGTTVEGVTFAYRFRSGPQTAPLATSASISPLE